MTEKESLHTFAYGENGDLESTSKEQIHFTASEVVTYRYIYEVRDQDDDGTPESPLTYMTFDHRYDLGGGYPPEGLPESFSNAYGLRDTLVVLDEDGLADHGWGVNWTGHLEQIGTS